MTGRWLCPVKHDQTRLVRKNHFWKLTGNDQMLGVSVRSLLAAASGQLLTVEIGQIVFKERGHMACIT